jgi:phosphohistidine swiveling domain-containing protein
MYCVDLADAEDISQVGGKAANLSLAASLGAHVPPGFVLTLDALRLFLEHAGLAPRVRQLIEDYPTLPRAHRKQRYEELCSVVLASPLPEDLKDEVASPATGLLQNAPVGLAVRSSGIGEDSSKASFSGVFESFLCVAAIEELWEKVLRCWCASWSPQAMEYAARIGATPQAEGMAVIVQQMVQAESAGVLFTADPLTGNPWRLVLNATFGLADALLDGSASSDRFVLAWDTGEVLESHIAEKGTAHIASRRGVREIELGDHQRNAPSLADGMARQIGQLALCLDRAFDRRLDIEWAVAGQEIHLIQVRPITALPAFFPHELTASEAAVTWTLSDPAYPAWYFSAEEGRRVVAPLFRDRWASELWLRHQPSAEKALPRPVWQERDISGYRYATTWVWGGPWQDRERTERWLDETEASLRRDWLDTVQAMMQTCACAAEAQCSTHWAAELIPVFLRLYEQEKDINATVWAAPQSLGWICEDLLRHLLQDVAPGFAIEELLQGLPCYSYERTMAAQELGRSAQPHVRDAFARQPLNRVVPHLLANDTGCSFLHDFERFCFRFGMRPPSWPAQWARWTYKPSGEWGQDATQTLVVIRASALEEGRDIRTVLEECARRRQASEAALRQRVAQHDPSRLGRLSKMLAWAQFWVPALDDRKWHCMVRVRLADLLFAIGTMLVHEGLIEVPNDLLLFTTEDLQHIAHLDDVRTMQNLYLARKREYERVRRLTPPEHLSAPSAQAENLSALPQEPEVAEGPASPGGRVLKGQGFAPGRVTGICRKAPSVNSLAFLDSLKAEHIIICPGAQTWDTDWLSLLMVASGLVTVRGSALHHAAQIARECGVPFVDLPEGDLGSIPDSALVILDGEAGTLTLLE